MNESHEFRMVMLSCCLVLLLGIAPAASGQLRLVSTSVADGATNVDTLLTFEMVFSAPLDTSARFGEEQDFFLDLELFPGDSTTEPEQIVLSNDLTKISFLNVHLTDNTKFIVLLTAARSTTGEMLDRPYMLTFTTGNALPTGQVSGTVTVPDGVPTGALVALFEEFPFVDPGGEPAAGAVVLSESGEFQINYVPPGDYFLLGFQENNNDGRLEIPQDRFGAYDVNGDKIVDALHVDEGGSAAGANLQVALPGGFTARHNFSVARAAARSGVPDAGLSAMMGAFLTPAGESSLWFYVFYGTATDTIVGTVAIGEYVFPNVFLLDEGDAPPLRVLLPEDWLDSDVAMDSIEANGGSAFRQKNPDAEINGGVFTLPENGGNMKLRKNQFGFAGNPSPPRWRMRTAAGQLRGFAAAGLAVWTASYYSEQSGEYLEIFVDARTGKRVRLPGEPGLPSTARANLDSANHAAQAWAADATLIMVGTHQSNLAASGKANFWFFAYYSAGLDSVQAVFMSESRVLGVQPLGWDPPSHDALPENWINSDQAAAVAEANGGGSFRGSFADAEVSALLSRDFLSEGWQVEPDSAQWVFNFTSALADSHMVLRVDALTGALIEPITGLGQPAPAPGLPQKFALYQNHPNPFNPATEIVYDLPERAEVQLTIYNLLGQRIRRLVDGTQAAGRHTVRWQGKDDSGRAAPTGLYFYTLRAGKFSATRKLLLLR